jgi:hypothetical protein
MNGTGLSIVLTVQSLRMQWVGKCKLWIPWVPESDLLLVDVATQVEVRFIAETWGIQTSGTCSVSAPYSIAKSKVWLTHLPTMAASYSETKSHRERFSMQCSLTPICCGKSCISLLEFPDTVSHAALPSFSVQRDALGLRHLRVYHIYFLFI